MVNRDKRYNIVGDEGIVRDFLNILPDLEQNEHYYYQMLARKKYNSSLPNSEYQLKRGINSDKERLLNSLYRLEIYEGLYTFDGMSLPNDSLVTYITHSPVNHIKAYKAVNDYINENSFKIQGKPFKKNPQSIALTAMANARSYAKFFDFDMDCGDKLTVDKVKEYCEDIFDGNVVYHLVHTFGGFHILVDVSTIKDKYLKKTWHNKFYELPYIDRNASGGRLVPIPGTYQGGDWIVKLYEYGK